MPPPSTAPRSRAAFTLRKPRGFVSAFTLRKPRGRVSAFTLARPRGRNGAFTLVEMLVVIVVISILLVALIPALSTNSARSLEGDVRNFLAQLENARLIAISERTKTRVLLPAVNDSNWGQDLALRAYMVASFNTTASNWTQRGNWIRASQPVAFDPNPITLPDGVDHNVISTRKTTVIPVAKVAGGTPINFTGAYVEFLANGSTNLSPAVPSEIVALADALVDSAGTYRAKNVNLRSQITIDPLTGSATAK